MATADRRLNRPARQVLAAAPLAALIALTGCATAGGGPTAPSPSDSPSSTSPMNPTPPVDDPTVEPVPEAGDDSQAAAIQSAEDAVTAYGRPDLGYDQWINGLYPHLSQTGAAAYEETDPARIPVRQVTGRGVILPASTEVALIVQVPTDAGPYNVSLSRPSPDAPWLADRIRPANG